MRRDVMELTVDRMSLRIGAGAHPAAPSSGGAGDLGNVVPRTQIAATLPVECAALGNVIPFLRHGPDSGAGSGAPALRADPGERPAPVGRLRRWHWTALVAASAAAHFAFYLPFHREPPPMASIGQQSISVELVLGADEPAGLSPDQGPSAEQAPPPAQALDAAEDAKPDETPPAEQPEQPVETPPVQIAEAMPDAPPPEPTLPPPPVAIEPPTQPAPAAVAAVPPPPAVRPDVPSMQVAPLPKPTPRAKPRPKKPRRVAVRGTPNDSHTTARAATASGGIGRGRSAADSNYKGLVMAHLQRYKQMANRAVTEENQGHTALVRFSLDGSGRVQSVSVARSSGAQALDRAVVAMVHNASPFPAPPDGRRLSFAMPVTFRMTH
jgi:protein TonB